MKTTFFGCSYSEIWVSPKNWETTTAKAALEKQWYVQCYFTDPLFLEQYPKGKPIRVKLNKFKTLPERKAAARFIIDELKSNFDKGYNPITGQYMIEESNNEAGPGPDMLFIDGLKWAFSRLNVVDTTSKDIHYIIQNVEASSIELRFTDLKISEVQRKHIRFIIDNLEKKQGEFSGHKFNKYRGYLKSLYNVLVDFEFVETNIINDIRKKKVTKKVRETLTVEDRIKIKNYIKPNFPEFWDFINIYYHSGGRFSELRNLKASDVELDKFRYKTLIKKGNSYRWTYRPIKEIAVQYWKKIILQAKKDDYLFSVGLVPGPVQIRREQFTRRWYMHVKKKLGITADFASLKHSNMDEISEAEGLLAAAKAAGHTNTEMVRRVYAVNEQERQNAKIVKMKNVFI